MDWRLLVSVLMAMMTGCSSGQKSLKSDEVLPLAGTFQVHRYTFNNGLKLLVVEDHSSPTFAYQTWYKVGSRDEVPGKTGLAHLFEHMMFKETKNLKEGEFDRLLESAGVQGENAFTSHDYTAYIQELPNSRLDLAARMESDRMVNLIINEKAFKTETEVVQNERRFRNENNPDGLMDQELFALAFTEHPYRWPVIGYQKDLESMSAADGVAFYRSYYSPNYATIVVTGDLKSDDVQEIVGKYYGNLPSQNPVRKPIPSEPLQTSARRKELKLNIQVEKLLIGCHIPDIRHDDMPALNVVQHILTEGKSSRLSKSLVDTGIATIVESSDLENRDPSLFIIGVNLQKGKRAAQAEAVVRKELQKLLKDPVSTQELEKTKNKMDFEFNESLNSNYLKAQFLGRHETVDGDFRLGLRLQEKSKAVTAADIQKVVKKYLSTSNCSIVTGVPK